MSGTKKLYDYFLEKEQECYSLGDYVRPFVEQGKMITVSGRGNSMLPVIDESCLLVMAPVQHEKIRPGDVLLYERADGHSVIHRVWSRHSDFLCMLGDNQLFLERNVPVSSVVAVVSKIRYTDGKETKGRQSIFRVRTRYIYKRIKYFLHRY